MTETLVGHLIDGRCEGSPSSFAVIDPSTGEEFTQCPDATQAQFERAVRAAKRAFKDWSGLSFEARGDDLKALANKISEYGEELAVLLSREQGKPLAAARREIGAGAGTMKGIVSQAPAEELLHEDADSRIVLAHRPFGVVGGIVAWNMPIILAAPKIAQALFTGNTMVLKPSPFTPLTTLRIGELAAEILPPGVLNILAGGADLGGWMTVHPDIARITFTGSIPTGKRVMASAADGLKRISLELGGNDAAIVLADADVDAAAAGIFQAAFNNCGQVCLAIKRVFAAQPIAKALGEALARHAAAMRVGGAFEPDVEMGPLQNLAQYEKVLGMIEDARARPGAQILAGGDRLDRPGYFIAPTIIAGLSDDVPLVAEEQFGPVLPILEFTDVEDAIRRANATSFGLCASVWTSNPGAGAAVLAQLEAGTVWVNQHGHKGANVPFGGFKQSGLGRERGMMGLKSYMEPQVVCLPKVRAEEAAA